MRRSRNRALWLKAQPAFVGNQGKTVIDPDFDIDDSGLPHERMAMPAKSTGAAAQSRTEIGDDRRQAEADEWVRPRSEP